MIKVARYYATIALMNPEDYKHQRIADTSHDSIRDFFQYYFFLSFVLSKP